MKHKSRLIPLSLALTIVALAMIPDNVWGIAAWGRKYKVDCATCHEPATPRLNALGHQFRKMGYRMDTEAGENAKPEPYKELGDWVSIRFRTGYAVERFSDLQTAGNGFNSFRTRNGFRTPDVTLFYAGALTKNLSLFAEVEFVDFDETEVQVFGEWFSGNPDPYFTLRMGQMHTLSRIGWAGFDRPTGITTPDVLAARKLTTSPVSFRVGEDQRGIDAAYAFSPDSRVIVGVYNGVNQAGAGNEGNGAGFGDDNNAKDVLLAFEQMLRESGFALFGYYGTLQRHRRLLLFFDNEHGPDLESLRRHCRAIGHERPGRGPDPRQAERIGRQRETGAFSHSFIQQKRLPASRRSGRESGSEYLPPCRSSEERISIAAIRFARKHRVSGLVMLALYLQLRRMERCG